MSKTTVHNPFDREPIAEVPLAQWPEIDGWLNDATSLHGDRSAWLPVYDRIAILRRAGGIMAERAEELALQIVREGGKPLADARVETERAINSVELCVQGLFDGGGREIPMDLTQAGAGRTAYTFCEPIGPVVAISAFNHPLNLIVHQVGPAVAAGCPVLIKPALETPLSCRSFVNILHEAGLPEAWCRFAPCANEIAEKMVTDRRTAFVSFIGSANVGWTLRSKLAPGTRVALEHGGAAPVIVDRDVERKSVIASLLKGGFYHSGQVCVSVQRVFVPTDELADFADQLGRRAANLIVGDPADLRTECGPLIRPAEVDRVESWVAEAVKGGGTLSAGGRRLGDTMFEPTVIVNPPSDAKVSRQEIFGPVICLYGYNDMNEAIARANGIPYAFQAAVFTKRMSVAKHCIEMLAGSTVLVNNHTAFRVDWMPFAGLKQSGLGTGGIGYTMADMTIRKMAVLNWSHQA